ncbi:MAG: exonuclease SbcCD subunit D [Anaerolineae bacterium]|nr:exonuclease SbcCD subunit D [Anaerolineae bacterium]
MSDPIRILHFADLHIGTETYGRLDSETGLNLRVVDFLARLDEVVAYAIAHEADLVLFAGDTFRTRRPTPTYQREFARRIHVLSQAAIPTVLLAGNHDVPAMEQRASSVEIFSTLSVPHVRVAEQPALFTVDTRRGCVEVGVIPYPVRQRLLTRDQFRALRPEELDRAVSEAVVALIRDQERRRNPDLPGVLAGHFSVESAHWGSERAIMVGRDVTAPLSALLSAAWDYVALGHIHQHQNLNPENRPPVVYPGSLERVDFGEEQQPKGFCWVELERGYTTWEFIPVAARPFRTLRVDVRAEADPVAAIRQTVALHDVAGAVVRLIVQMTPEQEPLLRDGELSPLLGNAFFAQINREVDRTVRDRLAGLEPDNMTPVTLLTRYLAAHGKPEADIPAYLEEAREIFSVADENA